MKGYNYIKTKKLFYYGDIKSELNRAWRITMKRTPFVFMFLTAMFLVSLYMTMIMNESMVPSIMFLLADLTLMTGNYLSLRSKFYLAEIPRDLDHVSMITAPDGYKLYWIGPDIIYFEFGSRIDGISLDQYKINVLKNHTDDLCQIPAVFVRAKHYYRFFSFVKKQNARDTAK